MCGLNSVRTATRERLNNSMTMERIAASNAQYIRYPFDAFVEEQRKCGIRQMEFVAQVPHLWCDHIECEDSSRIVDSLKGADMRLVAFSPKSYRYSVCAKVESKQGEATLAYFRNAMKIAKRLHSPVFCVEISGGCFDVPREILWRHCRKMLQELCETAETLDVFLATGIASPENSSILLSLAELRQMKHEVGSQHHKIILDTHVMSLVGEEIPQWFDAFGADIALVRFIDGNYKGPRVWGEGCLPCAGFFKQIVSEGYKGVFSQYRKGENDIGNPFEADERNYRYLLEQLEPISL